jgi:hypothetical protein
MSTLKVDTIKNVVESKTISVANLVDSTALSASGGSAVVGFIQAGVGAVARTVQDKSRDNVSLLDFAPLTDGANADAAIAAVLAKYPSGNCLVRLPPFRVVLTLPIVIAQNGVVISGDGIDASIIDWQPASGTGTCLRFSRGASVSDRCGVRDFRVRTTIGTGFKTAIDFSDTSAPEYTNVKIDGFEGSGSIGLKFAGRECLTADIVNIRADRPIYIAANPNTTGGLYSGNACALRNTHLIGASALYDIITIESAVQLTSFVVEGYNTWVHGRHGIYWPGASTNTSYPLTLRNVWREQCDDPNAYLVYITQSSGVLRHLEIDNFTGGDTDPVGAGGCNGFYLRGVNHVTLRHVNYFAAKSAIDVDVTVGSIVLDQFETASGSTVSLVGQTLMAGFQRRTSASPVPNNAVYTNNTSNLNAFAPSVFDAPSSGTPAIKVNGVASQHSIDVANATNGINVSIGTSTTIGRVYTRTAHNLGLGANFGTNSIQWEVKSSGGHFRPTGDNVYQLGEAALRVKEIFAATAIINTSDERTKSEWDDISVAERNVAIKAKSLLKKFKFNDSITEKGDSARIHFGIGAQSLKAAFESEGLVAENYAVLCYDEWGAEYDDIGNVTMEAGNRYGVRYEELLAFIIAAL